MPLESIIDDVTGSLRDSRSAIEACNESVAALSRSKTGARAMIAVLLHVQDHLRCVAASGSWQVFSSVPLSDGVVGRAYAQGLPQTVT
ncbi:MAG TPA: GGDEF domain-containing protein, partial [Micromonosporaceae bacterium]|nr:GGDEF domain-containing protein [Micromonosporaceae bacterium]